MFKIPASTYESLDTVEEGFKPYYRMWSTAMKFDYEKSNTTNGPLLKNNFSQL